MINDTVKGRSQCLLTKSSLFIQHFVCFKATLHEKKQKRKTSVSNTKGNTSPVSRLQRASFRPNRGQRSLMHNASRPPSSFLEQAGCNNNLNFTPRCLGRDKWPKNVSKFASPIPLINEATSRALLICHSQAIIRPCRAWHEP